MLTTIRRTARSRSPSRTASRCGWRVGSPPLSITRSSCPPSRAIAASTDARTDCNRRVPVPPRLARGEAGRAREVAVLGQVHQQDAGVLLLERAQSLGVPHRDRRAVLRCRARASARARATPGARARSARPPRTGSRPRRGRAGSDAGARWLHPARRGRPGARRARTRARGPGPRAGTRRTAVSTIRWSRYGRSATAIAAIRRRRRSSNRHPGSTMNGFVKATQVPATITRSTNGIARTAASAPYEPRRSLPLPRTMARDGSRITRSRKARMPA